MIASIRRMILGITDRLQWFPPLLARISVGFVFIQSGWGKLHNLDKVIGFFTELGIPAPQLQAPFVAGVEFVGGLLVLAGLLTRVAAVPLIGTMVVAILTAKKSEITGVGDLFALEEYLLALVLLWIAIAGPGPVSVDRVIVGSFGEKKV